MTWQIRPSTEKLFFSDFLGAQEVPEYFSDLQKESINNIFNELDKIVTSKYADNLQIKFEKTISSSEDLMNGLKNWLVKKKHGAEYGDFVARVVFPRIKKIAKDFNNFDLMIIANNIASDYILKSYLSPINKENIIRGFIKFTDISKRIPNYKKLIKNY